MRSIQTREWLLIIAILSLSEYQLFSSSYIFKDDQTLLNYISFASTIASLILAVIAIIYGFLQNSSSNETNIKIIDRIDDFKTIAQNISSTTNKSEAQVEKLNSITELLNNINSSMRESTSKIISVEQKISTIDEKNNKLTEDISKLIIKDSTLSDDNQYKKTNSQFSTNEINELMQIIFRRNTISNDVLAYILHKYIQSNESLSYSEITAKYILPIANANISNIFEYRSFSWGAYTTLKFLENFKLVFGLSDKNAKANIFFSDQFKAQISILANEVHETDTDLIKQAINLVDSL